MRLIHKTKYKNIYWTLVISILLFAIIYAFSYMVFGLEKYFSFIFSIGMGVLCFILIGRKIIVRHLICDNLNVTVEFLLRSNFKLHYSKTQIKNIVFKTVDYGEYGIYEKAIIIFKNQKNYHKDYLTFNLDDEPKWFWSNFKFPNNYR